MSSLVLRSSDVTLPSAVHTSYQHNNNHFLFSLVDNYLYSFLIERKYYKYITIEHIDLELAFEKFIFSTLTTS